jgi:hypothetical protein
VKPVTELLKKENKYVWSDACDEAFKHLKKLLTTSPVLAQLDTTKLFDVYCDASGTSLGGDEDITTLDTTIPSIVLQGPITRS